MLNIKNNYFLDFKNLSIFGLESRDAQELSMKAYWQYQEKFRNTAVRHKRYERLMRNKPAAQAAGADPSLLRRVDLGVRRQKLSGK